jgi:hypothetical protein
MHRGAISLWTRSGKTRPNRPASSQGLPEGGTITTPPYNAPMVGGAFPVATNLAPVREVPLIGDQPSVPTQQSIGRNDRVQFEQGLAADCLGFPREQCSLGVGEPDTLAAQPISEQPILGLDAGTATTSLPPFARAGAPPAPATRA